MKKHRWILLMALVFLFSYFRVPFLFFQQDEILGLGQFIKEGGSVILGGFLRSDVTHFIPVTMSLSFFIFKFFGPAYFIYNLIALMIHGINGILVYRLAGIFLRKRASPVVATVIFFSSSAAAQLIMWPVINLNTISLTFSLLAWLAVARKKYLWLPLLFLLAVLSLEYSAGLVLFIPAAVILLNKESLKSKLVKLISFALAAFGYGFLRLIPVLSAGGSGLGSRSSLDLGFIFRYFGQLLLGQDVLLNISKMIWKMTGLSGFGPAYAETNILPAVSFFTGILSAAFFVFVYLKIREEKDYAAGFLLSLVFILTSSLPFFLVPGSLGLASVISSRYLYFGLAGVAIVTGYVFEVFASRLVLFLVFLLVVIGTLGNVSRAGRLYGQGAQRQAILKEIKSKYPKLPEKVVFYLESDRSYYGLPDEEKIPPFQSGLGQTLLVYYYQTEKFPKDFFPGWYLWEIKSQGYEEHGNRGFGYYRDLGKLKKTLNEYKIPEESVIAFFWSGEIHRLTDVTDEIRKSL